MNKDKSKLYEALFELSQAISGHDDLGGFCRALAGSLRRVVPFDYLALLLHDAESDTLRMQALAPEEEIGERGLERIPPGEATPAGWVWTHQLPLFIPRVDREERWRELLDPIRHRGLTALFIVPLTAGEHRLGVLAFAFVSESSASSEERGFIQRVASEFAVTLDSHLTRQRYLRERDRLQLLFDLTNALVSKRAPEELFAAMTEQLRKTLDFDIAAILLFDRITGELHVGGSWCDPALGLEIERTSVRPEGLPAAEAIATGLPLRTDGADFDRFPSPLYRRWAEAGFRSSCSVPLATRNAVLGTLELGRTDRRSFSDEDVGLLVQISRQVAVALENSLAYAELTEMKERLADEKRYLEDEIRSDRDVGEMLGESPAFQAVLENIRIVAPTGATVLILGETGTGKELVARAIHQGSPRADNGFVKVNCAAIPASLLESELFGHEKGAFTGALARRVGRFELADKGTLFLDEIGEIPYELQSKLLRAIQEREFERLGGDRTLSVDVRIIAASNRDLKAMVDAGGFRSDLYYRLHVFPLTVPPLRERREDIPLLVGHFTRKYARRTGRRIDTIPAETMDILSRYEWPGNIRELQNILERSVILSRGRTLELAMPETAARPSPAPAPAPDPALERERILAALRESAGVVGGPDGAARRLGLKRTTLQARMKKLGIRKGYA
ncbi:MAG: sigma 54-interacting transcriptional regulator [Acidobacteria bacterium]|nr:sigma 54-interacting transcriptional regulator [Acidobacteriota bacterium]